MNIVVKKSQVRQGNEVFRFLEIVVNEKTERVEVRPGILGYELKVATRLTKLAVSPRSFQLWSGKPRNGRAKNMEQILFWTP